MSEDGAFANDFELFDEFVDALMSAADPALDAKHLWILIMDHIFWNFYSNWVLSNIAIIGLSPLISIKHPLECITEANNVSPVTTWKWTHELNNPTSLNVHPNVAPQTMWGFRADKI
jgi:hypothetical protein